MNKRMLYCLATVMSLHYIKAMDKTKDPFSNELKIVVAQNISKEKYDKYILNYTDQRKKEWVLCLKSQGRVSDLALLLKRLSDAGYRLPASERSEVQYFLDTSKREARKHIKKRLKEITQYQNQKKASNDCLEIITSWDNKSDSEEDTLLKKLQKDKSH